MNAKQERTRIVYACGNTFEQLNDPTRAARWLTKRQREAMRSGISGHAATSLALWLRWMIETVPHWSVKLGRFEDLVLTPYGEKVQAKL